MKNLELNKGIIIECVECFEVVTIGEHIENKEVLKNLNVCSDCLENDYFLCTECGEYHKEENKIEVEFLNEWKNVCQDAIIGLSKRICPAYGRVGTEERNGKNAAFERRGRDDGGLLPCEIRCGADGRQRKRISRFCAGGQRGRVCGKAVELQPRLSRHV